jgi:hypothetical protein
MWDDLRRMARTWAYAIALVVAASVLVGTSVLIGVQLSRPQPRAALLPPTGVVWEGRTFLSKAALRTWLRSRGANYTQWARHHPAAVAALEHRAAPAGRERSPATPVGLRRGHLSFFSGVWLVGCLALGAGLVSRDDRPHRTRLSRRRRRQVVDWIERAQPDDPAPTDSEDTTQPTSEPAHTERAPEPTPAPVDLPDPMSPELVLISHVRADEIAALPELAPIPPPPGPPLGEEVEQPPVTPPKAKPVTPPKAKPVTPPKPKPRRKRPTPPDPPGGKT